MKRFYTYVLTFFITSAAWSQIDGLSYQAVIIDNNPTEIPGVDIPSNNLPEQSLTIRFTIFGDGSVVEYQETQDTVTDPFGMINLIIGQGTLTSQSPGNFTSIYWNNSKYLRVDIDLQQGDGFIQFSYQELTYIPYVKHREIVATSTLDVDGATNLNSNFTVNNQSPTLLTGDLTVEGVVSFDGGLDVGGDTQLYADLTVEGNTLMNGTLSVQGNSNFSNSTFQNITVLQNSNLNTITANGNSNFNADITVDGDSDFNGQVTIDANPGGGQGSFGSYPLGVQGANQGIAIKVNGGRNASKNFVTFFDDFASHGAIEGQTSAELNSSFRYIWDAASALLNETFVVAEGIACGFQLDAGEAGVMAVQGLAAYAHLLELTINAENNVGVSFKTGGADYAEYLQKMDLSQKFLPGEIVGVYGGKISKNTENADHILVISTNPIVVGNMPKNFEGSHFEKVAFLGQVPVRVVGRVNVGDYILPSGNFDGIGIAKSSAEMNIEDYANIIGVAWEDSNTDVFGYINMAIGLNSNDLVAKMIQQQEEINAIKLEMKELKALVMGSDNTSNPSVQNPTAPVRISQTERPKSLIEPRVNPIQLDPEEFETWLDDYGYIFEERMALLGRYFSEKGVSLNAYPEVYRLIYDTKGALRAMNNGTFMPTLWESFKNRYPKAFTGN